MKGEVPKQAGNDHPTTIPTGLFRTSDGVINIAGGGGEMWRRIVEVLGIEQEAEHPELATDALRSKNRTRTNAVIQAKLETDSSANWVNRFNEAGVPCGHVYSMDQVFADEQVKHLGLAWPVQHPQLGEIALVRPPMQLDGVAPAARPTPARGQHTNEVLAEFGFSAAEISHLRDRKVI
jgi:crotonobetainyl-CoA:carnitine CoA-transferase CaiB-like acyl-CoA transferase